jgi:hypothetical protein
MHRIFDLFSKFKNELTSVSNVECSGQPCLSKTDYSVMLIKELVHESKNIIICDLANEMQISFGSCQNVLTQDLNM